MFGQIFADDPVTVRVAVKQGASALIQSHLERVEVSLADAPGKSIAPSLSARFRATQRLPSAALASSGGGDIAADSHADDDALLTREPVVWLDVKLADIRRDRIGGRAWIRFEHGGATLFERVLRGGRQLLLQHFSPGRCDERRLDAVPRPRRGRSLRRAPRCRRRAALCQRPWRLAAGGNAAAHLPP